MVSKLQDREEEVRLKWESKGLPSPDYFIPDLGFDRIFITQICGDISRRNEVLGLDLGDALDAWYLKRVEVLNTRISYLDSAPEK